VWHERKRLRLGDCLLSCQGGLGNCRTWDEGRAPASSRDNVYSNMGDETRCCRDQLGSRDRKWECVRAEGAWPVNRTDGFS